MRRVATGSEGMIGVLGEAASAVHEKGKVLIRGEDGNAFSTAALEKGKKVQVVDVKGLNIEVEERS